MTQPAWLTTLTLNDLLGERWESRASPFVQGHTGVVVCAVFSPGTLNLVDPDGQALAAFAESPVVGSIPLTLTVQRVAQGVYATTCTFTAPGEWTVRFTGLLGGLPLKVETPIPCKAPLY